MVHSKWEYPFIGELKHSGYLGETARFVIESQLLDERLWACFVQQFADKTDGADGGWRGEFWGKMMRGGCA